MSIYVLIGNGHKSSINDVRISYQKIIPHVLDQANLVGWTSETDAENVVSHGWQTATFVSVGLKCMEGFACVTSMII